MRWGMASRPAKLAGSLLLMSLAAHESGAYDRPSGPYGPPFAGPPSYADPTSYPYYSGPRRPLDGSLRPHPAPRPAAVPPPAVVLPPPAPIWSGLYLGGHAAYDFGRVALPGSHAFDLDGVAGGLQLGYNWQSGSWVAGVEADVTLVSARVRVQSGPGIGLSADAEARASLRGRLGYAVGGVLVYGTGGYAWSGLDVDLWGSTQSRNTTGWVVGGGIELRLTDPLSFRLEALHFALGDGGLDQEVTTVRAGLTWHFR